MFNLADAKPVSERKEETDKRSRSGSERKKRSTRDSEDDAPKRRPARKKEAEESNLVQNILLAILGILLVGVLIWYFRQPTLAETVRKSATSVGDSLKSFANSLKPKNEQVTQENYDKITPGMTRAEVEQLLQPGQRALMVNLPIQILARVGTTPSAWVTKAEQNRILQWRNDDQTILIAFYPSVDNDARVQMKLFERGFGGFVEEGTSNDVTFAQTQHLAKSGKPRESGPAITVTAEQLARAYNADARKADTKYKNRLLVVEGSLTELELDGPGSDLLATLETRVNGGEDRPIRCEIRADSSADMWPVSYGQVIKISGMCGGLDGGSVKILNGWVADAGEDPSVRITAAELLRQYTKNPKATNDKYFGKQITLTDALVTSDREFGQVRVCGIPKSANTSTIVLGKPLDPLRRSETALAGATVEVKGEYEGARGGDIYLIRTRLLP
jgi:hypothetical protein